MHGVTFSLVSMIAAAHATPFNAVFPMRIFSRWCLVLVATCLLARAAEEPPTEWIDPDTGHRIVRLSREGGTASLYFHQNAYSPDGRKLVVTNPGGIATIDLATRAIDQVVTGQVSVLVTGRKSGDVYYLRDGAVYATNLDTHATRQVAKFPAGYGRLGNVTVNADESLIVGLAVDPEGKAVPRTLPPGDNGGRLSPRGPRDCRWCFSRSTPRRVN